MQALRLWPWLLLSVLLPTGARAWNADGHHVVGEIAARLIAGSRAAAEVGALLGEVSLTEATLWADCAKSIDPVQSYVYQNRGRYPDCRIFETPSEEAAMGDFVRRNDRNCTRRADDASCHRQYHYANVPIQQRRYRRGLSTSRDDDVVAAIAATVDALESRPAGAPFNISNRREALLLLAHYVGDLHQPLHAGAIYLSASGQRVDPDADGFDPASDTRGGNSLLVDGTELHAIWDAPPTSLHASHLDPAWLTRARAVPRTPGNPADWPARWATESLRQAERAFGGIAFGPRTGTVWNVQLPAGYSRRQAQMQSQQLIAGGAHLAQLLQAIWPD